MGGRKVREDLLDAGGIVQRGDQAQPVPTLGTRHHSMPKARCTWGLACPFPPLGGHDGGYHGFDLDLWNAQKLLACARESVVTRPDSSRTTAPAC